MRFTPSSACLQKKKTYSSLAFLPKKFKQLKMCAFVPGLGQINAWGTIWVSLSIAVWGRKKAVGGKEGNFHTKVDVSIQELWYYYLGKHITNRKTTRFIIFSGLYYLLAFFSRLNENVDTI